MGAITSRRKALLPNIIKEFRDGAHSGVLCYSGWYGVGTSAAAKAVAKAAKEHKLFDPVIFVTAGKECRYAPGKLQRKIAKELRIIYPNQIRIDDDDDDDDSLENPDDELARMIYQLLEARNFLLIIVLEAPTLRAFMNGSLGPTHFLDVMGVIIPRSWSKSRILITSPAIPLPDKYEVRLEDQRRSDQLVFPGTIDDVLDQFREEAGYVASCSVPEGTVISADQVFHCSLYYLFLVKNRPPREDLIKYWIGEGLIILQQQQDGDDIGAAFKLGEAVLGELDDRRMLENCKQWEILEADMYHSLKSRLHIQILEKDFTPLLQHDARWISLANYNNIRTLVYQPPPTSFSQLSTLHLNDNDQLKEIHPDFFQGMPSLKVLDLSRTSISSLPPSLSCLVHLTFLNLQQCPLFVTSLPPTLNHLRQLIILGVARTPLSNIPEQSFDRLHSLRLIDLSYTNIRLLPPSLSSLCNLQQLLLAGCTSLTSLLPTPKSSLINLTSLEKLVVAGCSALEEVQLCQLRQLSTLEELDISGCWALKDVVDFSFEGMPKLRDINLSHNPQIARVSLRSCGSLEIARLEELPILKWLDLSGTKIKKFQLETTRKARLEHLGLTNVRYLESVSWVRIKSLPTKLKWDQCGCRVEDEQAENRDDSIARISVSNPRIFRGLRSTSPLWGACFCKFHFCISPCSNQGKKKAKKTVVDVKRGKPLAYAAVHSKIMSCPTAFTASRNNNFCTSLRHLEIEEVNQLRRLDDIDEIVDKARTLSLRSNGFLKSVTRFLSSKRTLTECRVERCHNMLRLTDNDCHVVFVESLWMSDLKRLGSLISGKSAFIGLKHLHIQYCPSLKMLLVGTDCSFPMLETLIIRFCARLECFFEDESMVRGSEGLFPRLHTLHLWELPKLERICAAPGPLPALQKLRVRACPKLRHLPLLMKPTSRLQIIKGEYK